MCTVFHFFYVLEPPQHFFLKLYLICMFYYAKPIYVFHSILILLLTFHHLHFFVLFINTPYKIIIGSSLLRLLVNILFTFFYLFFYFSILFYSHCLAVIHFYIYHGLVPMLSDHKFSHYLRLLKLIS